MKIELFFQPESRLCAHIEGERCVLGVKPVWASPLSRPDQYLALLDAKGKDFALLQDPARELSSESWTAAREELRRRDLTARIDKITSARAENGAAYFSVETDRGARDFVLTNISTNAIWFGENRLLLVDSDSNRFEIPDLAALDERSQLLLDGTL